MASRLGGPGGQFHLDLDLKFKCLKGIEVPIGFNGVVMEILLEEKVDVSDMESLLLKKLI